MKFPLTLRVVTASIGLAVSLVPVAPLRAADGTTQKSELSVKTGEIHYLAPGKPDVASLLAAPPLSGSAEQAADMDAVRGVCHAAGGKDIALANGEKKFSVFNFTVVAGPFLIETNLPRTAAFFKKVQKDAELVTDHGKRYFQRPRPYTLDPSLANGKPETSFSYPSGHSTESTVLALVLAELVPERRDAILELGRAMGWRRVQIARHYPTDIYAGRVLAQAIVQQMKSNEVFQKDMAEVKSEIMAAQVASRN